MEWVEVQGKSVDVAVAAALDELGLSSPEEATIEVLQEPKSGFLGMGGQEAIVKVTRTPKKRRRRRRGGRKDEAKAPQDAKRGAGKGNSTKGKSSMNRSGKKPTKSEPRSGARQNRAHGDGRSARGGDTRPEPAPIETQAVVSREFLAGLLDAFGLEGSVETRIEDDILYLNVTGDQTEALVGPRGSVIQAILELTRTVVQRKTYGAPRMRLDIAGYGERRRAALTIYAGNLAEKVLADGGEVMLEPMNAADRKVVHDAVSEISGVRSYSEGEDPHRAVVIAPEEGYTPPAVESVDQAGDVSDDDQPATQDDAGDLGDADDGPGEVPDDEEDDGA